MTYNNINLDDYIYIKNDIYYMLESGLNKKVAQVIMLNFDNKLQLYGNTKALYNFYYNVLETYKQAVSK